MKTHCAWCMKEEGIAPKPGESHTICQRHRAAVLAEYGLENAANVARTYKELRVERNTDLEDSWRMRLIRERCERTGTADWLWTGIGAFLAALLVLAFGVIAMAFP